MEALPNYWGNILLIFYLSSSKPLRWFGDKFFYSEEKAQRILLLSKCPNTLLWCATGFCLEGIRESISKSPASWCEAKGSLSIRAVHNA